MNSIIIGSGNVAFHLAKALRKSDATLLGIYSRNKKEGKNIATKNKCTYFSDIIKIDKTADIYLLCVSDDSIQEVVASLPSSIKSDKIVAHTSGAQPMLEILEGCKYCGIFYPLQTFSKKRKLNYSKIPFCITGSNTKTIETLATLAKKISSIVEIVSDQDRQIIHASAVLINNFTNHLIYRAEALLTNRNLKPSILQPLLIETIKKQKKLGAYNAQTGPARRADISTIEKHLDLLLNSDQEIYTSISKSISQTYKQ